MRKARAVDLMTIYLLNQVLVTRQQVGYTRRYFALVTSFIGLPDDCTMKRTTNTRWTFISFFSRAQARFRSKIFPFLVNQEVTRKLFPLCTLYNFPEFNIKTFSPGLPKICTFKVAGVQRSKLYYSHNCRPQNSVNHARRSELLSLPTFFNR